MKKNFYKVIDSYQGTSGFIKFDKYGDRVGEYNFWTIEAKKDNGKYGWKDID